MPNVESSLRASVKSYIGVPKKPEYTRSLRSLSRREKEVIFKYIIVIFNLGEKKKKEQKVNIFRVTPSVNEQFSLRLFLIEYAL